jgi:phosphoribosylamine--glycine ligase
VARALVVGSGGREHALVDALLRSPSHPEVLVAPGNAGIARVAECADIAVTSVEPLADFAAARGVDLVVVGPEAPLVAGLSDRLRARGLAVLGPSARAAELEGSKAYAKSVMDEGGVPTARWGRFSSSIEAIAFARSLGGASVVKADGLAAGKGVVVADDLAASTEAIHSILGGAHGAAGTTIVVEERLDGEELSVIALSDGEGVVLLAPAQDHKRIFDGDLGPNTGGMGAYAPAPRGTPELLRDVEARCLRPVLAVMKKRGAPFNGFLYAGLMLTADGPKVLEYNVRFGDPEAQAILTRFEGDAYALFLAAANGALSSQKIELGTRAALTVVLAAEGYPADPKKGARIEGLEEAAATGAIIHHAGTKLEDGHFVVAGGRVLGVTGTGVDLTAAAQAAYAAVQKIRFDGMQYRKDIGARAIGRALG